MATVILLIEVASNYKKFLAIPGVALPLLSLGVFSFISYIWAFDGSLIWHSSFCLLLFFLWIVVFSNLDISNPFLTHRRIAIGGIFISFYILIVIFLGEIGLQSFNAQSVLGGNYNYLLSLALFCAVPSLTISGYLGKVVFGLIVISIIIMAYVLSSTGPIVLSLSLGIFFLLFHRSALRGSAWIVGLCCIIMSLSSFQEIEIEDDITRERFAEESHLNRWQAIQASMDLFSEQPVFGVGTGNWIKKAYGHHNEGELSGIARIIRVDNHNYQTKLLNELGLLGLCLYTFFWIGILYGGWKMRGDLNSLELTAIYIIILYLIATTFYYSARHNEGLFSNLELIVACFTGILLRNKSFHVIGLNPYVLRVAVLLGALISSSWFIYYNKVDSIFKRSQLALYDNPQEAYTKLNAVSNDVFFNSHGFRFSAGYPISVDHWEALIASKFNTELANQHFEKALGVSPADLDLRLDFASFLIHDNRNLEATDQLEMISEVHSDNIRLQLQEAIIAIHDQDWASARDRLNHPLMARYYSFAYDYLSLSLYTADYFHEIVDLNELQLQTWSILSQETKPFLDSLTSDFRETVECVGLYRFHGLEQYRSAYDSRVWDFRRHLDQYRFDRKMVDLLDYTQSIAYLRDRWENRILEINFKKIQHELSAYKLDDIKEVFLVSNLNKEYARLKRISDTVRKNTAKITYYNNLKEWFFYKEFTALSPLLERKVFHEYANSRLKSFYSNRIRRFCTQNSIALNTQEILLGKVIDYRFNSIEYFSSQDVRAFDQARDKFREEIIRMLNDIEEFSIFKKRFSDIFFDLPLDPQSNNEEVI